MRLCEQEGLAYLFKQCLTKRTKALVERACRNLAAFLHGLRLTAERLTPTQRWYRILSRAMRKYLHGRQLQPPDPLPAPP
jgi:hypothetical protein